MEGTGEEPAETAGDSFQARQAVAPQPEESLRQRPESAPGCIAAHDNFRFVIDALHGAATYFVPNISGSNRLSSAAGFFFRVRSTITPG